MKEKGMQIKRCEIKQIAKAMNERYLNKLLSSGNRYLIRTDDMVETVYNDIGFIIKPYSVIRSGLDSWHCFKKSRKAGLVAHVFLRIPTAVLKLKH